MKRVTSASGLALIAILLSSCTAPVMLASGVVSILTKKIAEKRIHDENSKQLVTIPTDMSALISAQTAAQYYEIGQRYVQNNNDEMAMVAFQKSLQIDNAHQESLSALAILYAKRRNLTQAIALFEQVVALTPGVQSLNNLGYAYYLNKQYQEAGRVLGQAIAIDPSHDLSKNNLALVQANLDADTSVAQNGEDFVVVSDDKKITAAFDTTQSPSTLHSISPLQPPSLHSSALQQPAFQPSVQQEKAFESLVEKNESVYELKFPEAKQMPSTPAASQNIRLELASGGTTLNTVDPLDRFFNPVQDAFLAVNHLHKLEIVNANGTKGIARMVANSLSLRGVVESTMRDAKVFNVAKTQIQYRPGHRMEAVALKRIFKISPEIYVNDKLPEQVQVKLMLGKDLVV